MLAVLVLLSVIQLYSTQEACGPIGTSNEIRFMPDRTLSFYLNTANPAPCNGTITRWRYCYYGPSDIFDYRYRVTFAVYRRMLRDSGQQSYQRVTNAFTIVRRSILSSSRPISSGFNCHYESESVINIQEGDIVGACIYDPDDGIILDYSQLDIIGNANGFFLLEMSDVSECGDDAIPSSISAANLRMGTSKILHLSAEIDPVPTAPSATTTEVVETSASSTTVTTQTSTTPSMTMSPTTQETSVDTPVPTTITVQENTTSETTVVPITNTSEESKTTTAASTTLPPTTKGTTESTTATVPSTATTPQTDTMGEPTSEGPTTMMTQADTTTTMMTQADTTDSITTMMTQADTTDTTTAMMTQADTTDTTTTMMTQADTTDTTTTMMTQTDTTMLLTTTDESATTAATTQNETVQQTTTLGLDDTTSQPNTIGETGQQVSGGPNLGIIIGPISAVVLLLISGAVIVIAVALLWKRKKSHGQYSTSGEGILQVNGVANNINYSTGFCNLTALEASSCTYEVPMDAGATPGKMVDNHYYLAESTLSNTYEYVQGRPYSEIAAQYATTSIESEYHYSTHDTYGTAIYSLLERNKQEDIYGDLDAYYAPASSENEIYSQLQSCGVKSIPYSQIKITGHLGSGQFGNVEKGTWQSKEVALKTLKEGSKEQDKVKFLQEAAIMAQFKHPNIVTLQGVVSDKEPLMLVVEFMHKGDLRNYLYSLRPDPGQLPLAALPEMLLDFTQQVALGMYFLSAKGFVHRDLAARNILVSDDNICKIADFGMSRDLADENYYVSHGGMIPVKWTAPEAIHYKKYSTASDVWSYGCLLYEIWSLGYKPFEGTPNIEVIKIIDSRHRLSPPPGCPKVLYELMIQCWNPVASGRPAFRQLVISLSTTKDKLLSIPQEALSTNNLAGVLGSPLEAGMRMYADLQNQYLSDSNPDYDDYQVYN